MLVLVPWQAAPRSTPASTADQIFLLSAFIYEDVMVTAYEGDIGQLADSYAGLGMQVTMETDVRNTLAHDHAPWKWSAAHMPLPICCRDYPLHSDRES